MTVPQGRACSTAEQQGWHLVLREFREKQVWSRGSWEGSEMMGTTLLAEEEPRA
jgi:hypothetical protein